MAEFFKELWDFLKERKKWWLLPIIIVMLLVGVLLYMSSTSSVAPFVYTLFQYMKERDYFKDVATVSAVLISVALFFKYYKLSIKPINDYLLWAGTFLLVAALISSSFAKLFSTLWMKLGAFLGAINSRIILSIIFVFFLIPFSLLRRIFSGSSWDISKASGNSSWKERNHKVGLKDFDKMW